MDLHGPSNNEREREREREREGEREVVVFAIARVAPVRQCGDGRANER